MYKCLSAFLFLSLVVFGCGEEAPPEPAQPQAPPEPTPAEIHSELVKSFSVLSQATAPESYLPAVVKDEAVRAFNGTKGKHAAKANGQEALKMVERDVMNLVDNARKNEAWMSAKGGIEIYKSLNPGSDRYTTLEERVDIMLARPRVEVTGFMNTGDANRIFVRVIDELPEPRVETYTVTEGEEFHEKPTPQGMRPILKIVRVIGNNQEVEIEYIPIEDTWKVPGPKQ